MFRDIYQLRTQDTVSFSVQLTSKEHPIFKAHFKNNPLLPGFVFFEICTYVLNHTIGEIIKAKFIKPAFPEDKLDFFIAKKENRIKVCVKKEKITIAELVYEII